MGGAAGPSVSPGQVPGHPELEPGIAAAVLTVLKAWPQLLIGSTTGGVHADGSYHYEGRAVDLDTTPFDQLLQDRAGQWIFQNLASALVEGIHNPTLSVKNGVFVKPSFWGADTWAKHRNHIHLAV